MVDGFSSYNARNCQKDQIYRQANKSKTPLIFLDVKELTKR